MRTTYPVIVVACIGIAGLIVAMSGVGAIWGHQPAAGLDSPEAIEQQANQSKLGNNTGFKSSGRSESGDLVGMIISGAKVFGRLGGLVVMLPYELNKWLPWYAAYPLGLGAQILTFVGIVQAAANRYWR